MTTEKQWSVAWDAFGKMVFSFEGEELVHDVCVVRGFPVSSPDTFYSICSGSGKELISFRELRAVPEASRRVIERHLAEHEFLPEIKQIYKVSSLTEPSEWQIMTNRGKTMFVLENENDVRRIGSHQVMITDAQGIRYLVVDRRKLDPYSQRKLEWYIG